MSISITRDLLKASDVTAAMATAGEGTAPDRRRLYDLGDEVATLKPQETPLFSFSSQTRKFATKDPVFRFLEDRTQIQPFDRTFDIAATLGAVTAGSSHTFTIDKNAATSVDWLIKGMVFIVRTVDDSGNAGYSQIPVRVDSDPIDAGTTTTFTGKIIDLANTNVSGYNTITANDECRVIGTAFQEGTGAPDVWQEELEDDFGNCQIFKTAVELSGTAVSTEFRGFSDEWMRNVNNKAREYKNSIESAILFGQRATVSGVRYTEGIIGHIVKNVNPSVSDAALSYTSGSAYYRSLALGELTYDRILGDLEVLNDPGFGTGGDKLVMASRPIMSFFHQIADGVGFSHVSFGGSGEGRMDLANFKDRFNSFGHRILTITTPHGDIHLTENPQLRGPNDRLMVFVDPEHVAMRFLSGNGKSRDTTFEDNIQLPGEDARKAQWLGEIGFEITLPENHMLYHLEDN